MYTVGHSGKNNVNNEVTQEISEIQKLEGQKRILDE